MAKSSKKLAQNSQVSAAPPPVMYDGGQRQLAARAEQLAHVVQRLMVSNHALEEEVRRRAANEEDLKNQLLALQTALQTQQLTGDLRSQFITLASHEFRTPFSTILSSATLAGKYAEAGDAEKRDRHLQKIKVSVLHLTEMLHDFLNASQLDENKVQVRPTHFDFARLAEDVIESVKFLERAGLEIIWQSEQTSIPVFSDSHILEEVLQNLLTNAARFSKKEVICRARVLDGWVMVEVQDFGVGIPQGQQSHIFERFFRAGNVANFSGVGLGLHISKRFADLLGGSLTFESAENLGTTFYLKFPVESPTE